MNLYQEIYHGESFQEEDFYDAARYAFHQELAEASSEEIDKYLAERVNGMTAEEAESFWSSLGNIAKKVGSGALKVASVAAPIAGTAIGAAYGMPQLGGMAGGLVGNLAGAGAGALDKVPDFKSRRRRRRRPSRRRGGRTRSNAQLRQTWGQTKQALGGLGRAALRGANRYAKNNPVTPTNRPTGPILGKSSSAVLSNVVNNPQFQALLFGRANAPQGEIYHENINENDFDYLDMVEAINYLTEDIIAEYYEDDLLDDDTYSIDEYGELVVNYPEDRIERVESYIEELV
ncbi:hypothetical protein MBM09_00305 [Flaviramulus sp. BrNp1-15]|uniref:hypothetical protein n=1 Tax=Flaviramulus sp. BrNp1-15 TaxID=2916754 RepID=UPI001EE8FBE7|nr:hypothetical protein [Flaviramulus sp. BrNp1-15]ULC59437.1 hypothetical protein MBM09_00305 [Flaviramulus sp. BrNp1-15]